MSRVFITGSADGWGKWPRAGWLLLATRWCCMLGTRSGLAKHSRRAGASQQCRAICRASPGACVADQVNRLGRFDAVIHNAGSLPRAAAHPQSMAYRNCLRSTPCAYLLTC